MQQSPAYTLLALLLAGIFFSGCDFLDPTSVENPQSTIDDLEEADDLVRVFVPGVRAQFARALSSTVVTTSIASDDYSIHGTGLGGTAMESPERITPATAVINSTGAAFGSYWNLQETRALADFVFSDILPEDPDASDGDLGEIHYYRGMAFLMQAENFSAVPVEEDGDPLPSEALYERAEEDLQETISLLGPGNEITIAAEAALARLYRGLGDGDSAASYANAVLDEDDEFLFALEYDAQNLVNSAQTYLVERALREMQPLPRLDFLDPKYTSRESAIPIAKAEEMHLILAEVALAEGNEGVAKQHLIDAVDVIEDRNRITFEEEDQRLDNNLNPRPRTSDIAIAFEPGADFVEGLVLDRPCEEGVSCVETPTVSGNSITQDQIEDAANGTELTRLLYLMRQEVLFLEGRRLHDLGLRLPMMLREIEQSPVITEGDLGTQTIIPAYIPPADEMNLYTPVDIYEEQEDEDGETVIVTIEDEITMLHDMNRILAEERGLVLTNPDLP